MRDLRVLVCSVAIVGLGCSKIFEQIQGDHADASTTVSTDPVASAEEDVAPDASERDSSVKMTAVAKPKEGRGGACHSDSDCAKGLKCFSYNSRNTCEQECAADPCPLGESCIMASIVVSNGEALPDAFCGKPPDGGAAPAAPSASAAAPCPAGSAHDPLQAGKCAKGKLIAAQVDPECFSKCKAHSPEAKCKVDCWQKAYVDPDLR